MKIQKLITVILDNLNIERHQLIIANTIYVLLVIIICIALRLLTKYFIVKISNQNNEHKKIFSILLDSKLLARLSNLIIPLVVYFFVSDLKIENTLIDKLIKISIVIIAISVFTSFLKSIGIFFDTHKESKTFPIRGILQVIQIIVLIAGGIIIVSIIVEKSPGVLFGGIGAMTAITSIVFKDAILGFIAGIQLTGNDMIRIGDWIEVPKHSANGTVVDLSLTTVKVQNFDKSISLIPAYTLVSESFINWRGMLDTGARRIKRSIYIDVTSICIYNDILKNKQKNFIFLKEYLIKDIEKANGGVITNVEVFRAYIVEYLKNHPAINKDLIYMVRQLELGENGVPLEIYAFTNTAVWTEYEHIQSSIFDHLYAVISDFDLSLYQSPSSNDIKRLTSQS